MANDAAKRILIVDDDPSFRRLVMVTLRNDYATEEAGYGQEALERIAAFQPGLVLLDIVMPGIDGHETCRRIKNVLAHDPRGDGLGEVLLPRAVAGL